MSLTLSGAKMLTDIFDKYSTSIFGEATHPEDSFTEIAKGMIKTFYHKNGIWNDTPVEVEYHSHWVNIFNTFEVEA